MCWASGPGSQLNDRDIIHLRQTAPLANCAYNSLYLTSYRYDYETVWTSQFQLLYTRLPVMTLRRLRLTSVFCRNKRMKQERDGRHDTRLSLNSKCADSLVSIAHFVYELSSSTIFRSWEWTTHTEWNYVGVWPWPLTSSFEMAP